MKKKITITDRKNRMKAILKKGEPISKEDRKWIKSEFKERYYDPKWLSQCSFKTLHIKVNEKHAGNWNSFHIKHKTDGVFDLGVNKLYSNNAKKATTNQVLRAIIQPQIDEFKKENGVFKNGEAHADHIKPFHMLVNEWMVKHEYTWDWLYNELELSHTTKKKFKNKKLNKSWSKFHKKHAKLQILSAEENMSKGGKYEV